MGRVGPDTVDQMPISGLMERAVPPDPGDRSPGPEVVGWQEGGNLYYRNLG